MRSADETWAARKQRAKQPWVKEQIVRERGYRNLCLAREDLAEFEHQPTRADRPYRMVVLRKMIVEDSGQRCLGQDYRYFFYVTNDRVNNIGEIYGLNRPRWLSKLYEGR